MAKFEDMKQTFNARFSEKLIVGSNDGDGKDGASAYEIAVKNGFIGSETEWLESLKGEDGSDGKSAYQYAKDGGYTGTEEEFVLKLAQENPTKEEFDKLSEDIADLKENGTGTVSDEKIAEAVENYLTENPVEGGGANGEDGVGIQSVEQTTTSTEDGGINVITVKKTDGTSSTFQVLNGSKGSDGQDGYTPQKGIDYFTEADKEELVQSVFAQVVNGNEVAY